MLHNDPGGVATLELLLSEQDGEELWRVTVVPTDDDPRYVNMGPEPDLPTDELALLQKIAQVSAAAHVPFIAAARPELFQNAGLVLGAASGLATGIYQLFKARIDAKNGRKLRIKVGDIEVEATQMNEAEVLRIFELLNEKAEEKKIREALLQANTQPPSKSG
ncbi:MAG: type VI secretion system contractile sheath large subunit [Acidobacteriaceae bacterium]|nr:type VI secretion system contractile sheath large subunit [Acidobacteriaceae bacterium]